MLYRNARGEKPGGDVAKLRCMIADCGGCNVAKNLLLNLRFEEPPAPQNLPPRDHGRQNQVARGEQIYNYIRSGAWTDGGYVVGVEKLLGVLGVRGGSQVSLGGLFV